MKNHTQGGLTVWLDFSVECGSPSFSSLPLSLGGFPIEIESQINNLIYIAIFIYEKAIAKLYEINKLICVSILIGNPPSILIEIKAKIRYSIIICC